MLIELVIFHIFCICQFQGKKLSRESLRANFRELVFKRRPIHNDSVKRLRMSFNLPLTCLARAGRPGMETTLSTAGDASDDFDA